MQNKVEHATPSGIGRNSRIDAVTDFLEQRLDALVDQSIEIAKTNGYAPFTTTIRAAWVEAIVSVTDSLRTYLSGAADAPGGPMATLEYGTDPRFARMRQIARLHRSLGITLPMYIGLFKHFRNLYLAEIAQIPGGACAEEQAKVRDFFDATELSIVADWNDKSDNLRLRELQERSRAISLDKDRYFAIFESLQNAAFLLDRAGNLVNANQASAELFLGKDAQAGDIIYLRSMRLRKKSLQAIIDQIMSRALPADEPMWLDTLHGPRCFDIRHRALHDAVDNTALGHVVLLNDVTAHQRRAEEAKQSEQGMSRFLATMSHEIRTPLHSVLGAAELLHTANPSVTKTYLDLIESAGKALLQTLSNVLDYSKFENEPPVARPADTDLFEEIKAFCRFASVGRNLEHPRLSFDIDPGVPKTANLDWGKTQQVLSNLVSNALRADNGEGVEISISCHAPTPDARVLRFAVRDHGDGIPDAAAAALFRPFDTASARDTGDGGSGLGLAISHHLVEAIGGRIGYQNQSQGALVWFEVPLNSVKAEPDHGAETAASSSGTPASMLLCLLVDDDPVGSIVTTGQLERLGLLVTRAACVAEAMRLAASARFDVFVVDYLLPDGDGPSLVKSLKTNAARHAKFVALTANVEALTGKTEDFDQVLAKPAGQVGLSSALFGTASRPQVAQAGPISGFDGLQGLSPETVTAMIATFASAWAEFRSDLSDLRSAPEKSELAITAHRLAGSCAVLGLFELEPPLRQLETACLDPDHDIDLAFFFPALDRDLTALLSWQRLNARWSAE
ncbi:ATP-binding protein [Roseobacter sinensis]|uniref:histidine kinase n=1 Tax=Roseobacter sinensis TaxID=2931391 RepID=A0ABT3BHG9_9RHOB|nr:ATP-binding protein [Roseobacter sp. WL0113]MCV3273030.1 ATP-binding protein [Roseobacter sp. WL0113]